jgi:hypothetical protein
MRVALAMIAIYSAFFVNSPGEPRSCGALLGKASIVLGHYPDNQVLMGQGITIVH